MTLGRRAVLKTIVAGLMWTELNRPSPAFSVGPLGSEEPEGDAPSPASLDAASAAPAPALPSGEPPAPSQIRPVDDDLRTARLEFESGTQYSDGDRVSVDVHHAELHEQSWGNLAFFAGPFRGGFRASGQFSIEGGEKDFMGIIWGSRENRGLALLRFSVPDMFVVRQEGSGGWDRRLSGRLTGQPGYRPGESVYELGVVRDEDGSLFFYLNGKLFSNSRNPYPLSLPERTDAEVGVILGRGTQTGYTIKGVARNFEARGIKTA